MSKLNFPLFNYKDQPDYVREIISPPLTNAYSYVSNRLRETYESVLPKYLAAMKDLRILDYGCGVKPYRYVVEGVCREYIGADIGENANAEIQLQPGELLPFEDESFDVVISSQVLEHVEEFDKYLNECNRVLRKGGLLFLSTHGTWQFHAAPYDFNRWTHLGLKSLLTSRIQVIGCNPVLGQLAVPTQLRLAFFESFANSIGTVGKILFKPVAMLGQLKLMIEDKLTPARVKERDSAIFLLTGKKN
ncbi:MAG: class I SAM-dependent methyltransferase [Ignavibacteria bacterium]|nr:class I SAM-dependent methyltransferase [Ignavibacteria bacterium]